MSSRFGRGQAILGGERGGLAIKGFDLGNSPLEYTPERVAGKTVILTTTNGTKAMVHCRAARQVLIGAFSNLSAIVQALDERPAHLICAGTDGLITVEDVALAGAIAALRHPKAVSGTAGNGPNMNDEARIARDSIADTTWFADLMNHPRGTPVFYTELAQLLAQGRGGRNLGEIGLEHDIKVAAQIDTFSMAPKLDVATWRITV
jgi:2-phosphosulfolactate phosphatase